MEKIAREELARRIMTATNKSDFESALKEYVLFRLGLPEDTRETNIYLLVLYSVRIKMPDEDVKTLESRLATVDCHQTSYIVSKKTLLMMEIERALGATVSADDATSATSVEKYAKVLWEALENGR